MFPALETAHESRAQQAAGSDSQRRSAVARGTAAALGLRMTMDIVYDNVDAIGGAIVVSAQLKLLPTEQGGRHSPILGSLRPNHNFGDAANRHMFIGQIELGERESLAPGASAQVIVRFLNVRGLREQLNVGRVWRVQEGMKLIGTAEVLAIQNDT